MPSSTNPGMFDVIVHACSLPLTRAKLVAIGNSVASALLMDPSHTKVSTLTVQSWVEIGTHAAGEDPNTPPISVDFQTDVARSQSPAADTAWH